MPASKGRAASGTAVTGSCSRSTADVGTVQEAGGMGASLEGGAGQASDARVKAKGPAAVTLPLSTRQSAAVAPEAPAGRDSSTTATPNTPCDAARVTTTGRVAASNKKKSTGVTDPPTTVRLLMVAPPLAITVPRTASTEPTACMMWIGVLTRGRGAAVGSVGAGAGACLPPMQAQRNERPQKCTKKPILQREFCRESGSVGC
jgi:hypothetical protein